MEVVNDTFACQVYDKGGKCYYMIEYESIKDVFNDDKVKLWQWALRDLKDRLYRLDLENPENKREGIYLYDTIEWLKGMIEIYYELFY